jgi:hypothetical protein
MNVSNWAIALSVAALIVSICSLWLNFATSRRVKAEVLFKLRLEALTKLQAVEIKWQAVINELYFHEKIVRTETTDIGRKDFILTAIRDWSTTFTESLAHAKGIRKNFEEGFEAATESETRNVLKYAEQGLQSLSASHETMTRKLELLK